MEEKLTWKRNTWMNIYPCYQRLLDYLSHDVHFMNTFVSTIDPTETDYVARCIVNIFLKTGNLQGLIDSMIYNEFSKAACEGEGSVMRGNNIINKIEGVYVREIGANYLKLVVGDLVTKIATDPKLNLEIDPRKISLNDDTDHIVVSPSPTGPRPVVMDVLSVDAIVTQNRKKLLDYAQAFLDRITDPQMVEEMPREMRQIAARTAECAKKFTPDSMNPLIGGFIMLRFFSPAIATPESSKLIPPDVIPSPRATRNLILVAKVLQNTSNGLLFGAKEDFMACMNDFISQNKQKMNEYFLAVSDLKDPDPSGKLSPLRSSSERAFTLVGKEKLQPTSLSHSLSQDLKVGTLSPEKWKNTGQEMKPKQGSALAGMGMKKAVGGGGGGAMAHSNGRASSPPGAHSAMSNFSYQDIDLRSIDLLDLFDLHRVLEVNMEKVVAKYQKCAPDTAGSACDSLTKIVTLLKELGPSPKTRHQRKSKDQDEERDPTPPAVLLSDQSSMVDVISMLEQVRFLYQGPNDKQGLPVFYLIVNRIKPEFLDNVNPLVSHIFKVMDDAVNSGYSLIIDMSWASISAELKRSVYTHLPNLAKIFSRRYKKNVMGIYIVHPSAYTRAVVHFMRFFTSRKLKRKIVEIYDWKQLSKVIDTENIKIPETSKDYITKSYRVRKVNSKEKEQKRLIKFTANSLLNIDPSTKKLQNEKRIDQIEEISSAPGSAELTMKFDVASGDIKPQKKGILPFSFSSEKDLVLRRYVCNNVEERDSIIQDIYEMGFKNHWMKPAPEFRVVKVNQAGKHQERVFRLTIDSLLTLSNNHINRETSFAGIENVILDPAEFDIAWIKLKTENFRRKIICKEAKQLVDALNEALNRYTQVAECEEDQLRAEGDVEYAG